MDSPTNPSSSVDQPTLSTLLSRGNLTHISRKSSWGNSIPPPSLYTVHSSTEDVFDNIELNTGQSEEDENWNTLDNITALGLSFDANDASITPKRIERFSIDEFEDIAETHPSDTPYRPFNRWMKTLQKRGADRRRTVSGNLDGDALQREFFESPATRRRSEHKKSSSASSFGFVTAVKSASVSLASFSIAPRSRRTNVSSRHQRTDRSSRTSNIGRFSEDSSYNPRIPIIDQAVTNRSLQRRRVIEEIIGTEESYVGDIKFLMNVYVTLLASIPSLSLSLRASINRNLNDIVGLHEGLLGDLHRVVPHSEYTQLATATIPVVPSPPQLPGHQRWRSLDAVPENVDGVAWLQKIPGMTAEPSVAAEVAKAFGAKLNRFFLYEEYGAKYELMIRDIASAYRTMPQWEVYQKGLEALASSLSPLNSQIDGLHTRKALTIGDLLVKPIQRVCKYPLLFAELLKQTPVCDCPGSHMEIENVLLRLREATTGINRATDDPGMKLIMEKTWLLQDRLVFENMSDAQSKSSVRAMGHIHICGVLHVSWQTRNDVDGHYLICLLYRDYLILANTMKTEKCESTYVVRASIPLCDLRIEDIDNGRGLQCHTAPYSWKLVFECDHQLYEVTMTACSAKEELEWRSRLNNRSEKAHQDGNDQTMFSFLSLKIKPLGTVFGKPGTIARRISIHRATTVGPTSLCRVIIKNTNAFKETSSTSSINRSQSLLTTNRIPVLAPARADRIRLESLLADVWTRDIIPYPGMTSRARSENLVRTSAHSMMRKLSVASIASNFSKRSASVASIRGAAESDDQVKIELQKVKVHLEPLMAEMIIPSTEKSSPLETILNQADKENNITSESTDTLAGRATVHSDSLGSSTRRLVTLKCKTSWVRDGQRMITPPLRTSSANSVKQSRTISLSTVADSQSEDTNSLAPLASVKSTSSEKPVKKGRSKGLGMNKAVVAEGIRNFFR